MVDPLVIEVTRTTGSD